MSATFEPTDPERLAHQLRKIGYLSAAPPKPLTWQAAHDTIGHQQANNTTIEAPFCLGHATIIASGNTPHTQVVIHLEDRGDYYGHINHDLFFTDDRPITRGLLHYAHNYYVLAPPNCPREKIIHLMRAISPGHDTIR